MPAEHAARTVRVIDVIVGGCGVGTVATGLVVVAWTLRADAPAWTGGPGAALGFVALGASLLAAQRRRGAGWARFGTWAAWAAVALGGLALIDHAAGVRVVTHVATMPGTAACLLVVGASLAAINDGRRDRLAHVPALVVAAISATVMVGHLYGGQAAFGGLLDLTMQVYPAIGLGAISLGVVLASPYGPSTTLRDDGLAGLIARRLLPCMVAVPLLGVVAFEVAERAGFVGQMFGAWTLTTGGLLVGPSVVLLAAGRIARSDSARAVAIEERVTAEEERRERESDLEELADNMTDACFIIDIDPSDPHGMRVVSLNKASETIFGIQREQFVKGGLLRLVHPDDMEIVQQWLRRVVTGESADVELRIKRPDGSTRWTRTKASSLKDRTGQVRRIIALTEDVTERRRATKALEQAYEEQRQAATGLLKVSELKDEFLSAVSHELRTPLTVILGFAELALDESYDADEARSRPVIGRILESARKLERLIDDLLDLDRLARGVLPARRRRVDLREMVGQACADLDTAGHPLEAEVPDVMASIDPEQVARIVSNLLRNAIKYTPEGTAVRLEVSSSNGDVLVAVEDQGPGIPDGVKEEIFLPFRHIDPTRANPGQGVGLSLVKRYAELHGGTAWAEDRDAGGARFVVRLCETAATPA